MFDADALRRGLLMDEGRRQAYLAALDVDLYVARQPLPHAAPSWFPEWEFEARRDDNPTLADADVCDPLTAEVGGTPAAPDVPWLDENPQPRVTTDSVPVAKRPANGAVASQVAALTRQTTTPSAAQTSVPPPIPEALLTVPVLRNLRPDTPVSTGVVAPTDTSLRLGLSLFEWPGQLRVLIEMSDPDAPSLSAREHRLWNEIALALWGREQAYNAQTLPLFRFPPNARLKQLETPEAVREAVESFLQVRQGRSPVSLQLVFAGNGLAAAYLGERGMSVLEPAQWTMTGVGPSLLLPSLTQLLDDWQLKASAWRAMAAGCRQIGVRG